MNVSEIYEDNYSAQLVSEYGFGSIDSYSDIPLEEILEEARNTAEEFCGIMEGIQLVLYPANSEVYADDEETIVGMDGDILYVLDWDSEHSEWEVESF